MIKEIKMKSKMNKKRKAYVKYGILTIAGAGLYKVLSAMAFADRGYQAIGGEVFALFLPVIWLLIETAIKDFNQI